MITPETYVRKSFEIEAVRITQDNMEEVAKWCLAEIKKQTRPTKKGEGGYVKEVKYLSVEVLRPLNERQKMAFIGDWILKTGTSFKIYTDIAFHKNFEKKVNYDDALLPESDTEFMVLRDGTWTPLTTEEMTNTLAPIVRATMETMVAEEHKKVMENLDDDQPQELRVIDEPADTPTVTLSNPKASE